MIRSEHVMSMLIKLLIHHLETIDGQRETSISFKQLLLKNELKKQKKVSK